MSKFFVVEIIEDGIHVHTFSTSSKLNYWLVERGDACFLDAVPEIYKGSFFNVENQRAIVVIQGEIVIPKAKNVVKVYEV